MTNDNQKAIAVIERLNRATNDHALDAIVACFADGYVLESPTHPARSFRGIDQVRHNWTQILAMVPDITTRLVRVAVNDDAVWTELEMSGTRRDGARHLMRGVFIFGVKDDDRIHWGRMFLEPVDDEGGVSFDMSTALQQQLGGRTL